MMVDSNSKSFLRRLSGPVGTSAVIFLLVASGTVSLRNTQRLWSDSSIVEQCKENLNTIAELEYAIVNSETSARGYVTTGDEAFLAPFQAASISIDALVGQIQKADNAGSFNSSVASQLTTKIEQQMVRVNDAIDARRSGRAGAASVMPYKNAGELAVDDGRADLALMRKKEESRMDRQKKESLQTYYVAWYTGLLSTIAGLALVICVMLAVHGRRVTSERDAAVIRDERGQLQQVLGARMKLERRNRELDQHIRLFVDQIQDYAIFTMDTECRATSWNSGVQNVLGFSEGEFLGQDVRPMIFTPEANENGTTINEFATAAATGSASDDRWMMRKGGIHFWAAGMTSSIRDEADVLIGYSKVMRDMTQQKIASDEMSRLAAALSEESRRKNEFFSTLAHELRNPLSPIKNAVQLMGMMKLERDVDELRSIMDRQTDQLVRLIDDLMDISRIGRGKIELKKEIVEIATVINSAVEASRELISTNSQTLEVHVDEHGLLANVDPARITQVVCNLLNNASKYSDRECTIVLSVEAKQDSIVISVRDNGNGIAPGRLEDIFEMFSQLGDSVERGSAGLGIGLALVRTLVELHGGAVSGHSEGIGKGSEFKVTLPAASPNDAVETVHETQALTERCRPYRVLVVEDMRSLAIILARLLSKLGHHVEVVDGGAAAIEKLRSYEPEVIFSDISMPGMTGYELARYLRATPATKSLHLVAMTGYGLPSDREKALRAGFDEHIVKPVDVAKLQKFFAGLSLKDSVSVG